MYGIESGIGAQLTVHAGVVVSYRSDMKLLYPSLACIHPSEFEQQSRPELSCLGGGGFFPFAYLQEYSFYFCLGIGFGTEGFESVIGHTTAHRFEEILTDLKGFQQVVIGGDVYVGRGLQLIEVFVVHPGALYRHGFIGTPGWKHLYTGFIITVLFVILKGVDGIVCGADYLNVHLFHDAQSSEFGKLKLGRTCVIYLAGGGWIKHLIYTEYTAQFKVRPVI
ncbi:hypothetical protein SDC9_106007 [bioreactor metagenome]|uniref:Uncharacterized protein n=1 Tax=bioreactor metagenome TaxID=1076179 RepID=A0A645B266_9ZZZZ